MWQDAMLDFCNETLVPRFRSFSLFFLPRTQAFPFERDENAWSENYLTAVVKALFDP